MKRRWLAVLFFGMTLCACQPVQEKQSTPTCKTLTGKPEIVFGVHRRIRGLITEIRIDEGQRADKGRIFAEGAGPVKEGVSVNPQNGKE